MAKVYDMTVADAAGRCEVSQETIKRYARDGKVPAFKTLSGKWMFNSDDLDELAIHKVVVANG
jgi:excisionase family DNA binding protein